jgi:tetratricopeptide (TPR) repeat protein
MQLDSSNPVIQLCAKGMATESVEEALSFFEEAWKNSLNPTEACIAAHYLARHQATPSEELRWNLEAINRADAVGEEEMKAFYPSLYLNLAKCYEDLGQIEEAKKYYLLAAEKEDNLPVGGYRDWVHCGITEGLKRIGVTSK